MKLTRKQEVKLIELGMMKLLESLIPEPVKSKPIKTKRHWTQTASGKKKMARSMRKMWAKKREGKE